MNAPLHLVHDREADFRTPPANIELECALLGALLRRPTLYDTLRGGGLVAEHFADPGHAAIYAAIGAVSDRGGDARWEAIWRGVDPALFAETEGGVRRYLADLTADAMPADNPAQYGRTIIDLAVKRDVIALLSDAIDGLYAEDYQRTAGQKIEDLEQRLFAVMERGAAGGPMPLGSYLDRGLQRAQDAAARQGVTGIPTGIGSVDDVTGGLHATDYIVLAGRPGMCKTQLAFALGRNAARSGSGVLAFSFEMGGEQLAQRELAAESGVDSDLIRRGRFPAARWADLVEAAGRLRGLPIWIDDSPALSLAEVRARARRHKRRHGLALVIIDYVQLMRGADHRSENRVQEVSAISRGLKALAKELDVCLIAVSQLSRSVEARDDKRPFLSDLRESGSLEQDADAVWFPFRPAYYLREPQKGAKESDETHSKHVYEYHQQLERQTNVCELHIAKQRHGPTKRLSLFCDLATTRFGDFDRQHELGGEAPF